MNKRNILVSALVLSLLVGCSGQKQQETTVNNNTSVSDSTETTDTTVTQNTDNTQTETNENSTTVTVDTSIESKDSSGTLTAVEFTLDNSAYEVSISKRDQNSGYEDATEINMSEVTDSVYEITAAGTYVLTGTYNGQIRVLAGDEDKVQLVFRDLTLKSDECALLIGNADKVFITLEGDNYVSDGSSYSYEYDGSNVDGAVFAKCDLTINGEGTLTVTGNNAHGIVTKDDLTIVDATVKVTSTSSALDGNDSVVLYNCTVSLNAGTNGIRSNNDESEGKGFIYIDGADVTIKATEKGIKAYNYIQIDGGDIDVTSSDDAIHSDNEVVINGGTITISTADDAIHGDYKVTVNGGTISIKKAAEGIEATLVVINGGDVDIYATDDGINAAQKITGVTATFEMNDGNLTISMASGDTDAIDSNGNLKITGGKIDITAQFAFDFDGQVSFTGGTVYVNGSQVTSITNSMMGGGGMGQMGGQPNGNNGYGPGGNHGYGGPGRR